MYPFDDRTKVSRMRKPGDPPSLGPEPWRPPMAGPGAEWRSPVAPPDDRPRMVPPAQPSGVPGGPMMNPSGPAPNLSRQGVPLPQLPTEGGGPQDWSEENQARYDKASGRMAKLPGAGATDPIGRARFEHQMGGMKKDDDGRLTGEVSRGGMKQFGLNLLHGALKGMGSGGGPMGALGGAMTGAAAGALDPSRARDVDFEARKAPGIERDMRTAEMSRQRQRQIDQDAIAQQKAKTDEQMSQADILLKQAQAAKAGRDEFADAPWGTYNRSTGRMGEARPPVQTQARPQGVARYPEGIYDRDNRTWVERFDPSKPMTRDEAMAAVEEEDMAPPSQIAADSLAGRLDALKQTKLTPREAALVSNIDVPDAEEDERVRAMRRWEGIQAEELKRIQRETDEKAKGKARSKMVESRGRSSGSAKPAGTSANPAGSGTRSRSALASRYGDVDLTP